MERIACKLKIIVPSWQEETETSEELVHHTCSSAFKTTQRNMGKGSQGQIYASLHIPTMKMYAMKRVRSDLEISRELEALVDLCRFADICHSGAVLARRTLLRPCRACCSYNRYEFMEGCIWAHRPNSAVLDVSDAELFANQPINLSLSELFDLQANGNTIPSAYPCPYVVQFYDSFPATSPESQCFVMEYMGCGSLKSLLSSGKDFTESESAVIAYSILRALHHINSKGYIHGDIKPSNVLLDASGGVKLSDFGSACKLGSNVTTRSRQTTGTMAYMPPEFFEPERGITEQSDIWSLGTMLLHLLCGEHPFTEARNYWSMRGAILESTFPSMLGDNTYSVELEFFLERCLIHDVVTRAGVCELLHSAFLQSAAVEGTVPFAHHTTCTSALMNGVEKDIPRLSALVVDESLRPLFQTEAEIAASILSEP